MARLEGGELKGEALKGVRRGSGGELFKRLEAWAAVVQRSHPWPVLGRPEYE